MQTAETNGVYSTYNILKNVLRIYSNGGVFEKDTHSKLMGLGFLWAARENAYFTSWSPEREDMALSLCGKISVTADEELDADIKRIEAREKRAAKSRELSTNERTRSKEMHESAAAYWEARAESTRRQVARMRDPGVRKRKLNRIKRDKKRHEAARDSAQAWLESWLACSRIRDPHAKYDSALVIARMCYVYLQKAEGELIGPDPFSTLVGNMGYAKRTTEEVIDGAIAACRAEIRKSERWIANLSRRIEIEQEILNEMENSNEQRI